MSLTLIFWLISEEEIRRNPKRVLKGQRFFLFLEHFQDGFSISALFRKYQLPMTATYR